MRTLIVAPNWIGDAVMAQPLLAMLRAADPDGRIEVLAPPHVAPVFEAMAETDAVIEARNEHGKPQLRERWRLARDLRRRGYDRCHVLPNSLKSALVPFLAGIPERIGRRGEARYGLINRMHDDRGAQRPPMVEFYAQLALPPGRTLPTPVADPVLRSDPAHQARARSRVGIDERAELIVLCPGAEYGPAKRWPTAHFATLAQLLARRRPAATLAVIGSAKERALASEIATLARVPMLNLCGETSLGEALALIASADAIVSNDSGLMHVAAALGRPQVAVFGSSDPRHTPPRSPRARVHWLQLECSPCFERVCPLGHLNCLNGITPESVLDSLEASIRTEPTTPEPR